MLHPPPFAGSYRGGLFSCADNVRDAEANELMAIALICVRIGQHEVFDFCLDVYAAEALEEGLFCSLSVFVRVI